MFYLNDSKFNLKGEINMYCKKIQVFFHVTFRHELGDKYFWVKVLASTLSTCVYLRPKKYLTQIQPLPFTTCILVVAISLLLPSIHSPPSGQRDGLKA